MRPPPESGTIRSSHRPAGSRAPRSTCPKCRRSVPSPPPRRARCVSCRSSPWPPCPTRRTLRPRRRSPRSVAFSASSPVGNLVKGTDGALYGVTSTTTSVAGGLIYRTTVDGSSVTTLYQMRIDQDGQTPQAGLLLASDGKFYGTTKFGKSGTLDTTGTIYRINQDGTGFTVLHRFAPFTAANVASSPINTDGAYSSAELIEGNDGFLYGITGAGGPNGTGAIYKIGKDGSGFQVLHTFSAITANKVAKVVRSATAQSGAGTTVSTGPNQSVGRIAFDSANTRMTVRVYSPAAGIRVRLKVEDAADSTHAAETEATTTVANAWETLTFDFANPASGTAALNFAYTYNKVSIYFNFGTTGATAGAKTYYFDDVTFLGGTGGGAGTFTPVTFDAAGVTYTLTGFGGAEDSTVVVDPAEAVDQERRGNVPRFAAGERRRTANSTARRLRAASTAAARSSASIRTAPDSSWSIHSRPRRPTRPRDC